MNNIGEIFWKVILTISRTPRVNVLGVGFWFSKSRPNNVKN